jgi:uncharacterized membrane protein YphA (DoxX/SURF4 family)
LWALQILLALAFLGGGVSKLVGTAYMVNLFDQIGMGNWFRYLTGVIEVVSSVALLVPGWARFGALNLVGVMAGAVATHLFQIGGSPIPALVLLALVGAIAWGRRYQALLPWASMRA